MAHLVLSELWFGHSSTSSWTISKTIENQWYWIPCVVLSAFSKRRQWIGLSCCWLGASAFIQGKAFFVVFSFFCGTQTRRVCLYVLTAVLVSKQPFVSVTLFIRRKVTGLSFSSVCICLCCVNIGLSPFFTPLCIRHSVCGLTHMLLCSSSSLCPWCDG